ncbi:MAG: hypothetical protein RL637_457 [Pseudomonadota bacterium]|jgi:hypothetical protein
MKKMILLLFILNADLAIATPVVQQNFSGVYDCQGNDAHEGNYKATATLEIEPKHSDTRASSYHFSLEVPGFGLYRGHGIAEAEKMAIYFALNQPNTQDYGTGIATFSKNANGKYQFVKHYYEPQYEGGNHGSETCIQR